MRFVILATGPSLTDAQVERVSAERVIAVSDSIRKAPWAEILVSSDRAWWLHHKPEFKGQRYSAANVPGCSRIEGSATGTNSGVLAIRVARHMGATQIVLLGYDGHGSHFFGEHPSPLSNTTPARRKSHLEQHRQEAFACGYSGVSVLNCSPGSKIPFYKSSELEQALC